MDSDEYFDAIEEPFEESLSDSDEYFEGDVGGEDTQGLRLRIRGSEHQLAVPQQRRIRPFSESPMCPYCREEGGLFVHNICLCRGSGEYVHYRCLDRWINTPGLVAPDTPLEQV